MIDGRFFVHYSDSLERNKESTKQVVRMKQTNYEKSIMYSVQVATLEKLRASDLIGEEEHRELLRKVRNKYDLISDVDIIGG